MNELFLVGAALISGVVSAVVGMVGGTLLLVVMSMVLPVQVVIPIHGIVQFSSNFSRVILHRRKILWNRMVIFALGVAIGSVSGAPLLSKMVTDRWDFYIGVAVLLMTWIPLKKLKQERGDLQSRHPAWLYGVVGGVGSFLSLFVGAIGIVLGAFFLREQLPKETHLGTQAFCQVLIHLAKVIVFLGVGFAIGSYLWLTVWMIAASFIGNVLGTKMIQWLPDRVFYRLVQGVVTILAIQLIIR